MGTRTFGIGLCLVALCLTKSLQAFQAWQLDGESWSPFLDVGFHTLAVTSDGSIWASDSSGRVARLIQTADQ